MIEAYWRRLANPYRSIHAAASYDEALELIQMYNTDIHLSFPPPLVFFMHDYY
jgi:hypothetical protein